MRGNPHSVSFVTLLSGRFCAGPQLALKVADCAQDDVARMGPEFEDDPVDEYVYDGDMDRYFTLDQLEHAAQYEVDQARERDTERRADSQRTGSPPNDPPVDAVAAARGDADAAFAPITTPLDSITKHPRELVKFDGGLVIISEVNPTSGLEQGSFLFQQAAAIGWSHAAVLRHIVAGALRRAELPLLPAPEEPIARDPETIARGEEMPGDMLAVWTNTVEEAKLLDGGEPEEDEAESGLFDGGAGVEDGTPLRFDAFDDYAKGFDEWADENGEDIVHEGGEVGEEVREWAVREGYEPATSAAGPPAQGGLGSFGDFGADLGFSGLDTFAPGLPALDDLPVGGAFDGPQQPSPAVMMDDIGDFGWTGGAAAAPQREADVDLRERGLAPETPVARDRQKVYVLCGGDSSERNVSLQGGITVRPPHLTRRACAASMPPLQLGDHSDEISLPQNKPSVAHARAQVA